MAQDFYIRVDDSNEGPFTGKELREMALDGRIGPESLVSLDQRKWVPASSFRKLTFESVPPSAPGPSVTQRMKTGLQGAASLIGDAFSGMVAAASSRSDGSSPTTAPPALPPTASFIDRFLSEEQDPKTVDRLLPKIQQIVMAGEEILYIAVQKKPIANITPDCVVLTTKRFIFYQVKLLGQIKFEDRIWRELLDARITEGIIGAKFTIRAADGAFFSIDYLPKAQARHLYRLAQEMEENSAEERRQRGLEEKRAGAGGVVLERTPFVQQPQAVATEDPVQKLTKLKQMLDAGLISSDEYESKKADVLSRM